MVTALGAGAGVRAGDAEFSDRGGPAPVAAE
jgi:hypothetical protein